MEIKINGESQSIEQESVTMSELLKIKEVKMPDMVSVEYNGEMLDRDKFDSTQIQSGDEIEFLYFMGGGETSS